MVLTVLLFVLCENKNVKAVEALANHIKLYTSDYKVICFYVFIINLSKLIY